MTLKDRIPLGMSLPHRSPDPIDIATVTRVATRADALGFQDLWVTENTLDHVFSFDPIVILTHAAAVTKTIRVGCSVIVATVHNPIHVAHQWGTLDYISGGRVNLGVGIGHDLHYQRFQVPAELRIRRFREQIGLIRALWTQNQVDFQGQIYSLRVGGMSPKPVQMPHPPIWLGGDHPNAIRRAARLGDAWMGSGGSSVDTFLRAVPMLREALDKEGRDAARFPISKRVFVAVDERPEKARAEALRWYTEVYRNPPGADSSGVHGTPEQVRERLEELVAGGATHLLLNPVSHHVEQLEALAEVVGFA